MRNTLLKIVEELVWEEIVRGLPPAGRGAACAGRKSGFCDYLARNLSFPLKVLSSSSRGGYDLIVGWQVNFTRVLELCYRSLEEGGTADLYGFYSRPSPDGILSWERRLRGRSPGGTLPLPLPGAVSLGRVAARLKESPFGHYGLSQKGIYYRLRLLR